MLRVSLSIFLLSSTFCCIFFKGICLLYLFFLLSLQTYRELVRLSEGVGFRVHIIDKASLAAKKYGPQSNKKYGKK